VKVRYVDGPTSEAEIYVAAPPDRVWALVTDIELPARFSNEFCGAEWVGERPGPAVGAAFRGRNQHPAIGAWESTSVVVACEAGRVFGWDVQGYGGVAASWRFELEPEGDGTRLRHRARMGPARSGLTAAIEARPDKEERIIERRLEEWHTNLEATIRGIKQVAETPSS
jgi:uncharacterized protein YndB with AHSA1/START domain